MFEFKFEAFGTELSIKVLDEVSIILQEKIKLEVYNYTVQFDELYSRFKENSLVNKIVQQKGKYIVPKEFVELLKIYGKFNEISDGFVNPLIGNTISDLGYDEKYSLIKKNIIRDTPLFQETLSIVSENEIELKEKVLIDVGAIGKGFWVDKVCLILEKNNLKNFIVNGSGDIYFKTNGEEKLNIELENIGNTAIINEAICGSGIDRRNWGLGKENLHHIINPKTKSSSENIKAVWVKAENAGVADALTTCLFFIEPAKLIEKINNEFTFEYLIVYENKKILFSKNFNAILKNI